jgi:hypothetical protein
MTLDYLIGELSVLLEKLLAVSPATAACDVVNLRLQVEIRPVASLAAETARALALADGLCWDSLSRGDAPAFDRQAAICAELRLFCACARLVDDE